MQLTPSHGRYNKEELSKVKKEIIVLQAAVSIFGLAVLFVGGMLWLLPIPQAVIVFLYVTMLPFYRAIYHTLQGLEQLKQGQGCDQQLLCVKQSATVVAMLYVLALPGAYYIAELNDAPGVIVLSLIVLGITVSVIAASTILRKVVSV